MVSSASCIKKYGQPGTANESKYMTIWEVPDSIRKAFSHVRFSATGEIGFPKRIYVNKDFLPVLHHGLNNVIGRQLTGEIKTWDGVYIIRQKRLSKTGVWSLHAWALAFDINAAENAMGKKPKLSPELVACFTDVGADWGGYWNGSNVDGMHFQIARL